MQSQTPLAGSYLWTHHKVWVWLHMAGPDPGILLANCAQPHAVLSVEWSLLVRASQDNVLALGKVADATRIKGKELVLSDLKKRNRGKRMLQWTSPPRHLVCHTSKSIIGCSIWCNLTKDEIIFLVKITCLTYVFTGHLHIIRTFPNTCICFCLSEVKKKKRKEKTLHGTS